MRKKVVLINPLEQSPALDLHSDVTLQPRYGTVSIATRIRDAGYDIRFFCEMSGSVINWDDVAASDYVCFSLMSFCSHRGYELMKKVRTLTRAPIICGGSHATMRPDECLDYADYVVRHEGEETIADLLAALDRGRDVAGVAGISFLRRSKAVHTPGRAFIRRLNWSADYALIDGYRAQTEESLFNRMAQNKPWFHFPVSQISRGCPRNCAFCFVKRELGPRYRKRDPKAVRTEIERLAGLLGAGSAAEDAAPSLSILFVDNDFCVDKKFSLRCLSALKDLTDAHRLEYQIFTRIETARDADFIRQIKNLGVGVIFLGIESIHDPTLHLYGKDQSKQDIVAALKVCRDHDMKVLGFFVLGADTDTSDVAPRSVEFAIENRLHHIGLFSLYGFPDQMQSIGIPQIIGNARFIHHDWRFFNSNFVVHFPLQMKPSRLQRGIIDGYRAFDRYALSSLDAAPGAALPERRILKTMEDYCVYLKDVEKGLYDRQGRLQTERLSETYPPKVKRIAL